MIAVSRRMALVGILAGIAASTSAITTRAAEPLKALIVDGQNNHDWKATTPALKQTLEASGRFKVHVATSPDAKASAADWEAFRPEFSRYDVVVSNYNGQPWPAPVREALEKYVSDGGGLVVVHAANNSFPEWPAWNDLIGLGWRDNGFGDRVTVDEKGAVVRTPKGEGPGAGHGPQHEFAVVVRDAEHPIMKGLPATWMHARDELYHGQRGPAKDMHILATAFSAKEKGGTGTNEPMLWVIPFGKGRVFTTVMGHVGGGDTTSVRCVGFQTTLARGAEWAATGKVTLPVPSEFPKDKVLLAPAH